MSKAFDLKKLQVEYQRIFAGKLEQELNIMKKEEEIERLRESLSVSDEALEKIQEKIEELKALDD